MYDPFSGNWNVTVATVWIDLFVSLAVVIALIFFIVKSMKRISLTIASIVAGCLCITSWFFGLNFLWAISLAFLAALFAATLIQGQAEIKEFFSHFFKKKSYKNAEKVYDRHAVCQRVALAVETLSKAKIGALITFEKGTSFTEIVKSGTILNAPITPELLVTIFYPGTRLHDGAVVIRRDQILAASVYYTPTTRPLTGKFGSRHRAAIGISEVTDSVTIVVSEETGRVSLAYHGELISVAPDSFLRTVEEYLFTEEKSDKEEK